MSLSNSARNRWSRQSNAVIGLMRRISAPLSALAFWSAILIPVLYMSLLVTGIDSTHGLLQFLGLVGLHILALIGGQFHHRPD